MKALLLRVGIDKGCGGTLGPIFDDGSFELVPIPESVASVNAPTYHSTIGTHGKRLSFYVPAGIKNSPMHVDPEFVTNTYGDSTTRRYYLLRLEKGDLLVFYAGLRPFETDKYQEALYIIGYFSVKRVTDLNRLSDFQRQLCYRTYRNNAHLKRQQAPDNLVIVAGDEQSKLLRRAFLISQKKPNKRGRLTHALSSEMEAVLGISGFIERSIPPRFVSEERRVVELRRILASLSL